MPGENILQIKNLKKSYDGKTYALGDVSLDLRAGELVSLIGCSGAGKSTLLRCINSLIKPSSGSILFAGSEMSSLSKVELRKVRRRISMVFQHYNLVHRASAVENVLHGRLGYKGSIAGALGFFSEEEKLQALRMLERVGLSEFAYTRVDQLSGGQKQRVGIARALVQDPLLILADEPIASLDPKSSKTVMELLRWASKKLGVACFVSLHQVDFALEYSDRIIGLEGGAVLYDGKPDDLTPEAIAKIYQSESDLEGYVDKELMHGFIG